MKEVKKPIQKEERNSDYLFGNYVNPQETLDIWENNQFTPNLLQKKKLQISKNHLWLSERILELWVKLENIFIKNTLITNYQFQSQRYYETRVPKSEVQEYNEWRKSLDIKGLFSDEEIQVLENLLYWIKRRAENYGMGLEYEFEILPYLKSQKFTKSLWIASQFLEIQRYLIRCLYYITEQDYTIQRAFPGKPDFICLDIREYQKYLTRISIHHGLRIHTFKLIVEGKTEEVLIQKYIDTFWHSSWAKVINMRGVDNYSPYEQVFREVNDTYYWYLLDFDNGQHEEEFKDISNKTWFYPDFITEFFTPDEIIASLNKLLIDKNIEQDRIDYFEQRLKILLEKLKRIISNSKEGFELVITEFIFDDQSLKKIIFPNYSKWKTKFQLLKKGIKKTLKNLLNKQLSLYLEPCFIRIVNNRHVRNKKFDEKMNSFLKYCDSFLAVNWMQQASKQNKKSNS
ncbi:MAG: hypothetical protein K9W44_06620 [Candidatus Lokiarchaeota archaeon]|nr:hypothetical protein [Candidatus Harpocratesius repetitus]